MVPKELIAKRIRDAMILRGVNQQELSKRTGIDKGSISHYVRAHYTPKKDGISKIASALHVNPVWLMGYDDSFLLPGDHVRSEERIVPILGTVAAGAPIYAEENVVGYEHVNPALGDDVFALQIHGASMEPRIFDGDVVIVRRQDCAESGQIVIALVDGSEATCKRFIRYADGTIALLPFNPSFAPLIFPASQCSKVTILGRVLEARSKFT